MEEALDQSCEAVKSSFELKRFRHYHTLRIIWPASPHSKLSLCSSLAFTGPSVQSVHGVHGTRCPPAELWVQVRPELSCPSETDRRLWAGGTFPALEGLQCKALCGWAESSVYSTPCKQSENALWCFFKSTGLQQLQLLVLQV